MLHKRIAAAMTVAALALSLTACSTWPDEPITEGTVTDLYYVAATDGGPRIGGGRRPARPAAWSTIIKNDEGSCRLNLSEGLYSRLAVGDSITMEPCGLILTINGQPA